MKCISTICIVSFISHFSFAQSNYWAPVGGGFNNYVETMYYDSVENILYAGGNFFMTGSDSMWHISKWNGSYWDSLGNGIGHYPTSNITSIVRDIERYKDKLWVAGSFNKIGFIEVSSLCLGTWNGSTWDTISEWVNGAIEDILVRGDSIFICGSFDSIGNQSAYKVAMYDGSQWHSLNLNNATPTSWGGDFARRMMFYHDDLYMSGVFYDSSGVQHRLLRWNGTQWYYVEPDIAGSLSWTASMEVYNDMLIVSGSFPENAGNADNNIQAWDGNQWHSMGGGTTGNNSSIWDLMVHDGKLFAVGSFLFAGGIPADRIATWDGSKWCGLGGVFNDRILTLDFYNDTLFVGGGFTTVDGNPVDHIGKYLGSNFADTCSIFSSSGTVSNMDPDVFIYPNPANSQLKISFTEPFQFGQLKITNSLNQLLLTREVTEKSVVLDIVDFPVGMYVVQLEHRNKLVSRKFIKE